MLSFIARFFLQQSHSFIGRISVAVSRPVSLATSSVVHAAVRFAILYSFSMILKWHDHSRSYLAIVIFQPMCVDKDVIFPYLVNITGSDFSGFEVFT